MVGLEGSLKITQLWNSWVGRFFKDQSPRMARLERTLKNSNPSVFAAPTGSHSTQQPHFHQSHTEIKQEDVTDGISPLSGL